MPYYVTSSLKCFLYAVLSCCFRRLYVSVNRLCEVYTMTMLTDTFLRDVWMHYIHEERGGEERGEITRWTVR
jgi:hypothetical protein